MSNQTPSVGRIVHYQSYGTPNGEYLPEPRAAIITEVKPGTAVVRQEGRNSAPEFSFESVVSLAVINPTGMLFNENVPFSETPRPGHWNWPPVHTRRLPRPAEALGED